MRYSRTGEGMHRFTDPTDGETYVYTQSWAWTDVQRVFAAFDQPDLKAVFELTVTAPDALDRPRQRHRRPAVREPGRWEAAATPPHLHLPRRRRRRPLALRPHRAPRTALRPALPPLARRPPRRDADELLDITRACFDRYHEMFDEPYPFDSYDQAFVPEFNAGAMENPGLVTFRDEFVFRSAVTDTERQTRAMVIAHEMAHMWFGDLVTLRWWDDIWLNESFAEYMGYQILAEATRFTDTWTDFGVARKPWGYDADQRPSTHPVAPGPRDVPDTDAALLNFDGISYAKGASALRQLVAWLGEKDFLAGINTHFARHRFGNATLADFIDSLASRHRARRPRLGRALAAHHRRRHPGGERGDGRPQRRVHQPSRQPAAPRFGRRLRSRARCGRRAHSPGQVRGERRGGCGRDRPPAGCAPSPARSRAAERRRSELLQDPVRPAIVGHGDLQPGRHRGPAEQGGDLECRP